MLCFFFGFCFTIVLDFTYLLVSFMYTPLSKESLPCDNAMKLEREAERIRNTFSLDLKLLAMSMHMCIHACTCVVYVCMCVFMCICIHRKPKWIGFQTKVISHQMYVNIKGSEKSSLALLSVMKKFTWDFANDV